MPSLPKIRINPIAKIFMISESFFWSGWSILLPLISIFALSEISQATIQTISFAYSIYLILRVVGSIISGLTLNKTSTHKKTLLIISGMLIINMAYIGFISISTILAMYILYGIAGIFTGIISPLRASLFSTHMDKHQETIEWGLLDAIVLTTISIAAAASGLLVTTFGYKSVFLFSALLNSLSILPYLALLQLKHVD